MSSPDRSPSFRPRIGLAAALAATLLVAGCAGTEIRPLYASGSGGATAESLRRIDIAPGGGRIGQVIRNELVFSFYGGAGEPTAPATHRLDITVTSSSNSVGIVRNQSLPSAYVVQLTASWVLTELAGHHTVASGTSFANAAFDYSQQRFADLRALRDAENRAAGVIATDIRTKVAILFAGRR
jgi:LPS-assembly lipoprotein